jgi:uncharacterized MAPEG superfamily protein
VTTELYWLTLTALMTALFWVPYVLNRIAVGGLGGALAGTSPTGESHSDWANRAIKAHTNAIENLAIFAPIVLTAHVLNISSGATKAAVVVYFFARLIHPPRFLPRARSPSPPAGWRRSSSSPAFCAGSDRDGPSASAGHRHRRRPWRRDRLGFRAGGP